MSTNFLQDLISSLLERTPRFGGHDDSRSIEELCGLLSRTTGENSIKTLSAIVLEKYQALDDAGKLAFFTMLAEHYDVDCDEIAALAQEYKRNSTAENLGNLLRASEPGRQELLRRLNHVSGATRTLVAMRADLLKLSKGNESLRRVDLDFAHLFASWFNRGFLIEERVSWDSSASVLAKIIKYEAVHAINDWEDLRRRIHPRDRRCFAFFHPAMPNEPLVFVEVALCNGTPNSVQNLLLEEREPINPQEADTAVFYSISNCQAGLQGISFGNSLIKQVATDLARELSQLSRFVTLSPLPGFARWVREDCTEISADSLADLQAAKDAVQAGADATALDLWNNTLLKLAARYLLEQKRTDGSPVDPVARFHLNNGASLHALHALADRSTKGLETSFGVMVNYQYDLKLVEEYHEAFATDSVVHASKAIKQNANGSIIFPKVLIGQS